MSVNNSDLNDGEKWIALTATPEIKSLLVELTKRYGNTSQSAMVRILIQQEANRLGISIEKLVQPA